MKPEAKAASIERRREARVEGDGAVCLSLETWTARATLLDHSKTGLCLFSRAELRAGQMVYCAVPGLAQVARARVVHVRRWWIWRIAGLEYMPSMFDLA